MSIRRGMPYAVSFMLCVAVVGGAVTIGCGSDEGDFLAAPGDLPVSDGGDGGTLVDGADAKAENLPEASPDIGKEGSTDARLDAVADVKPDIHPDAPPDSQSDAPADLGSDTSPDVKADAIVGPDGDVDAADVALPDADGGLLPACADGVDNDGDGLTDVSDLGCSDALDTTETGSRLRQCHRQQ